MLKKPPTFTYPAPAKMPVFATLAKAVRDAVAACRAMPALCLAAFTIFLVKRLVRGPSQYPPIDHVGEVAFQASAYAEGFVMSVLTVPIIVALHRFAILREVTSPAFLLFRRDTVLLYLIVSLIPTTLMTAAAVADSFLPQGAAWEIVFALLFFVGLFWMFRFVLVLPGIAVESGDASLRGSARATAGRFWRLFTLLMLAVALPMLLGHALVYLADASGLGLLGAIAFAACMTITLAVGAMALSHAFLWGSAVTAFGSARNP